MKKPKAVGKRIRARRLELGLTQRSIGEPGSSYAYISRIESGERSPSIEALVVIAEKLDTTAHVADRRRARAVSCVWTGRREAIDGLTFWSLDVVAAAVVASYRAGGG